MFIVHEFHVHVFGQVHLFAGCHGVEEPVLLYLIVCYGILSIRREGETTDTYIFCQELLRTILHVHQVDVYRTAIVPLRLDAVLLVVAHQYPIGLLFVRYVHHRYIEGTQLDERVGQGSVDVSGISLLHVTVLAEQLNGLKIVFVPCPDIELRLFEFGQCSVLFQWLRSCAEEKALTVLAEAQCGIFADNPTLLQTCHLVVCGLLEAGVLDVIQIDVDVLLGSLGGIGISIESHGTYFAERRSLEFRALFTLEHFLGFTGHRIVEVQTSLTQWILLFRFHHVSQPAFVFVELIRRNVLDGINLGSEYIHHEQLLGILLRSRLLSTFLLVSILLVFLGICLFLGRSYFVSHELRPFFGSIVRLVVGNLFHITCFQVDDSQWILRHIILLGLLDFCFSSLVEEWFYHRNHLSTLLVEASTGSSRHRDFLSGAEVFNHQFYIAFLRSDGIHQDIAIPRNGNGIQILPWIINGMIQGRLLAIRQQSYQEQCQQ